MREFIRNHRFLAWLSVGVVTFMTLFIVVWFEPHKLFIEETVSEAPPSSRPSNGPAASGGKATTDDKPSLVAEGRFESLEHSTSGTARVLELADGRRFLRLEDLDTSNGPDLRVYLSEIPASDDWYAYGERYIDLGALKGNRGDQNYEVPTDTDLSRYESVVVWCRRFTVGFGVAGLKFVDRPG